MRERIVTISGLSGIGEASVPRGATPNATSPTGYTIGPAVGNAWLIDIAELMRTQTKFPFPVIKMVYWSPSGKLGEHDVENLRSQIDSTNRWVVVTMIHGTDSPYVGFYVVPIAYKSAVVNYGAGLADKTIKVIRAGGEVLTHAGSEIVKTTVEAARDVYQTTVGLGANVIRALEVFGVIAALGLTLYGVNKVTGGAIFGGKKS